MGTCAIDANKKPRRRLGNISGLPLQPVAHRRFILDAKYSIWQKAGIPPGHISQVYTYGRVGPGGRRCTDTGLVYVGPPGSTAKIVAGPEQVPDGFQGVAPLRFPAARAGFPEREAVENASGFEAAMGALGSNVLDVLVPRDDLALLRSA